MDDTNTNLRDFIIFHVIFAIITALLLLIPLYALGWRILTAVAVYNVGLPLTAVRREHRDWLAIWTFVLPVSILQIFPDWFLSAELGILNFPDTGSPFIGSVPVFMGGMWAIPLFAIIYGALRAGEKWGRHAGIAAAALLSLVLFAGSEATLWAVPIWEAREVQQVAHIALYLLIPETLLGISALMAFRLTRQQTWWVKLTGAFAVMIIYLGNTALFFFIVERLILA